MPDGFDALVARVVGRVPAPRIVTRAEYEAVTCNRCGACCEDIPFTVAPAGLAAAAADPDLSADARAWLLALVPNARTGKRWRYRCPNFTRDSDGLGVCAIYATRPDVCRDFPYGKVVREWPQCSWYVRIRDDTTIPTETLPVIDRSSAASAHAQEG